MLEQLSIKLKYLAAWATKTHWNKFAIFIIIIMIIITVSQPLLCTALSVWEMYEELQVCVSV